MRCISEGSTGHVSELWLADFDLICLFLLLVVPYHNDRRQHKIIWAFNFRVRVLHCIEKRYN